jgi:hypothetical protein
VCETVAVRGAKCVNLLGQLLLNVYVLPLESQGFSELNRPRGGALDGICYAHDRYCESDAKGILTDC